MVSVMKVLSTLSRLKLLFVHMRLSVGEPRMGAMFCVSSAGDRHASKKPYIHRERQPVWEFPMPHVKTGDSPRLVKILARRRVKSKKRRTFLYRCQWDEDTWSRESSKALEEDPVYLEFLPLHPE